jgi:NADH-quinone oxidoreductase subunit N
MNDYTFDGFNGLARREPLIAATLTILLLSLAGIPLTAGFLAKFYMLKATIATPNSLWLVIFAVLMAAVSVYYYFRVIQAMYFKEGNDATTGFSPFFKWTMVLMASLVILLGLFPDLLLNWLYF